MEDPIGNTAFVEREKMEEYVGKKVLRDDDDDDDDDRKKNKKREEGEEDDEDDTPPEEHRGAPRGSLRCGVRQGLGDGATPPT